MPEPVTNPTVGDVQGVALFCNQPTAHKGALHRNGACRYCCIPNALFSLLVGFPVDLEQMEVGLGLDMRALVFLILALPLLH